MVRPFIPDGCVGLWFPGRGHPGQRRGTVLDLSGRNNHGTIMGVPCLYFDGAGDKAALTSRFDALVGHRYAWFAGWINVGTQVNAGILYEECWNTSATTNRLLIYVDSDSKLTIGVRSASKDDPNCVIVGVSAISKNVWHSLLVCVDLVGAGVKPVVYAWLDGAVHSVGASSANSVQGTFAASVPSYQAFGLYHTGANFQLLGYLQWLGFGGLDAPPTIADAKSFHDHPQAWLAANFAALRADYWTCKSGTGNPVAGSGIAGRVLVLTGAAWNSYIVTAGAHLGPCLGDARNASGTPNSGDSFNAGYRFFDGVDDCLSIPDGTSLRFGTSPYQLHVWAAIASDATPGVPICGKGDVDAGEWRMYLGLTTNAGKLRFYGMDAGGVDSVSLVGGSSIMDGNLHLCSVLCDGTNTYLYLDGVELAHSNTAINLNEATKPIQIMASDSADPCKGNLYKVFIGTANKTIAQAAADMLALYAQGPYK